MVRLYRAFGIVCYVAATGLSVIAILAAWNIYSTYGLAGGFVSAFVIPLVFFLVVLALPPFILGRLFMKWAQQPDNTAK